MAIQSRAAQVVDAVLALTRAQTGYRSPSSTGYSESAVTVFDGPEFLSTDDYADGGSLIVGFSGLDDTESTVAGTVTLNTGPIAASVRPRDEQGSINCMAISPRRDTPKQARDSALAMLETLAGVCRSDPSLGIDGSATIGGYKMLARVTAGNFTQQLVNGYECWWAFTIDYSTRV
jgi:hypothetical protein